LVGPHTRAVEQKSYSIDVSADFPAVRNHNFSELRGTFYFEINFVSVLGFDFEVQMVAFFILCLAIAFGFGCWRTLVYDKSVWSYCRSRADRGHHEQWRLNLDFADF